MSGAHATRFENIDVLRGVAALLVIWLHAAEVFIVLPGIAAHGYGLYDAADLLNVGRMGVIAFFAISGYVIVPTVVGPQGAGTRDFVIKRFFRLFPPFWLSMAVAAYTVWYLFGRTLTWPIVAANATMVPVEWGLPQMMGHYWTLEVELIFYGLVLALFWMGHLHREKTIALFLLALSIAWPVLYRFPFGKLIVDRNLVWSFLAYFLTVMFWGAMVRARRARRPATRTWRVAFREDWPYGLVTTLVFGRPVIAILFGSQTVHQEDWRGTFLGLLLFLLFVRIPARRARPFVWIGTVSYSLYLFHPAVFYPLFLWVARHEAWSHAALGWYVLASMIVSIACAGFVYRLVEAPSNAYARRLVRRLEASQPEGVPT